jgi:hypothetical protein
MSAIHEAMMKATVAERVRAAREARRARDLAR